jgi:hypothetical protein
MGSETANWQYVEYEINQSIVNGNGLIGIYIHNLKDRNDYTSIRGMNPFDKMYWDRGAQKCSFLLQDIRLNK